MLVKRLISWRNWASHILLLCLHRACPGHPCCPPEASLGEDGDGPFAFYSPLGRVEEQALCCPKCYSEEMQLDFRAPLTLTVWSYHHQGCDERSPWITTSQCFWWIKHKFIHMPWAFLIATVSQLGMFLKNRTSGHHLQGHCIRYTFVCLSEAERFLELFPRNFPIP